MGSNGASVGNFCGKQYYTFTSSLLDTGAFGFDEVPPFYKERNFQLIGAGTGYSVQLFGTLDQKTATGVVGAAEWFPLPPGLNGYTNPITSEGVRMYRYNGALAAMRAVASAANPATISGSIILCVLCTS